MSLVLPAIRARLGLIGVFLVLDTAVQIAFKLAAKQLGDGAFDGAWLAAALSAPMVWCAVLLYLAVFVLWMLILQQFDLSRAFPLAALTYVTVPAAGLLLFHEERQPGAGGGNRADPGGRRAGRPERIGWPQGKLLKNWRLRVTDFKCSGIFAMLAPAMLLLNPPASHARDVAGANDITGLWLTDDGQGAVQIEPCGDKRCGRIVWLKTPLDKAGRPMRDANNPDPEAKRKPLCGAVVIKDVAKQTDGTWDGGSIYDPEEGKAYSVMLRAENKDRLEVRGYIGIRSFGETMIWTRGAEEQLKRCQPDAAKAKDSGKAKDAAKAK